MLKTMLLTLLIVAACLLLLGIKVWLGGKFPNSHVSGNKAMRERGIGCVQSQDREAQKRGKFSIEALEKANEERDN